MNQFCTLLHEWCREMLWRLHLAWMRYQFAQSDKVLETLRAAARLQAQACLKGQWRTGDVPRTQQQADRLAQFAAERYVASMWRPKRARRLMERAAPDIFRSCFRETLLPNAGSNFHQGGPFV